MRNIRQNQPARKRPAKANSKISMKRLPARRSPINRLNSEALLERISYCNEELNRVNDDAVGEIIRKTGIAIRPRGQPAVVYGLSIFKVEEGPIERERVTRALRIAQNALRQIKRLDENNKRHYEIIEKRQEMLKENIYKERNERAAKKKIKKYTHVELALTEIAHYRPWPVVEDIIGQLKEKLQTRPAKNR